MDHHAHLRRMAMQAANEDEDALLWALAEVERLRAALSELATYADAEWVRARAKRALAGKGE
jgi:hypothetical protein